MGVNYTQFGYDGALYLQKPLGNYRPNLMDNKVTRIIELINRYNQPAKSIVEGVKRKYTSSINETLKEVTGLKFRHKKISAYNNVTVDIVTSIPPDLMKILANLDEVIIELILSMGSLYEAKEMTEFIGFEYESIVNRYQGLREFGSKSGITSTAVFLLELIKQIEGSDLYTQLNKLSMDNLLGAYFFYQNRIEIYWPALAFYSSWKRLPLSDLAFIVLTHEKAHAITHMGFDLDGERWATDAFHKCDIKIVEGLAQHYTEHVCDSVDLSYSVKATFSALMEGQDVPYKCYKEWLPKEKGRDEKIRLAMLNTRKSNLLKYEDFENELKQASEKVK